MHSSKMRFYVHDLQFIDGLSKWREEKNTSIVVHNILYVCRRLTHVIIIFHKSVYRNVLLRLRYRLLVHKATRRASKDKPKLKSWKEERRKISGFLFVNCLRWMFRVKLFQPTVMMTISMLVWLLSVAHFSRALYFGMAHILNSVDTNNGKMNKNDQFLFSPSYSFFQFDLPDL